MLTDINETSELPFENTAFNVSVHELDCMIPGPRQTVSCNRKNLQCPELQIQSNGERKCPQAVCEFPARSHRLV